MGHTADIERFERIAKEYDDFILRVIPFYAEQNSLIMWLLPFEKNDELSVLDLGSGTGALAHAVLDSFPRSRVHAVDLSQNMLDQSHKRLAAFGDRYTTELADLAEVSLSATYGAVLAGLSIHHLDDRGKRELFKKIFRVLKPGGIFILRDVVLGSTNELTERYKQIWKEFMKSNGIDAEKVMSESRQHDQPATVEDQVQWLNEAGFINTGCHWRHLNVAVFGGQKPNS